MTFSDLWVVMGCGHGFGLVIGCPEWGFCVNFGLVFVSGFELDVGWNEVVVVLEVFGLCWTIGLKWFAEILDDEAGCVECFD